MSGGQRLGHLQLLGMALVVLASALVMGAGQRRAGRGDERPDPALSGG